MTSLWGTEVYATGNGMTFSKGGDHTKGPENSSRRLCSLWLKNGGPTQTTALTADIVDRHRVYSGFCSEKPYIQTPIAVVIGVPGATPATTSRSQPRLCRVCLSHHVCGREGSARARASAVRAKPRLGTTSWFLYYRSS